MSTEILPQAPSLKPQAPSPNLHASRLTPVLLVFFVAAVVRMATIWCGTNVDEGVYWVEGRQICDGYLIYRDTQFNKTPLVALVAASFFVVGDTPIIPMRLGMIALSMLGLFAIYRLAKELFGSGVALAALILMALEPYSCVWAKYLHTSSWAPWFEGAVFFLLISGLKQGDKSRIAASGLILGVYALSKQTAIYVVPPAFLAWFLFTRERNLRVFLVEAGLWIGSILLVLAPFFLFFIIRGVFDEMWYDIWTAHHKMAVAFADHTLSFRWGEFKSMIHLAPLLWWLPLGSLLFLRGPHWRGIVFAWTWLIVELLGNVFLFTHVWRHYFLVCMVPAAILAGVFWQRLVDAASNLLNNPKPSITVWISAGLLSVGVVFFWPRNDWTYPGLSLAEEKKIAAYVERSCPEPYLLNLTNPALYVWTGKQIPPAQRDGHTTRIPFFMTIAGRGYVNREDMEQTIETWRTLPIGCVVAYDKYVRQIIEDPIMEPLKLWLSQDFQPPKPVRIGQSYYGWFFVFEHKKSG
ncbi:MAG: glycosyltransferase family 39 protein [bacterium]